MIFKIEIKQLLKTKSKSEKLVGKIGLMFLLSNLAFMKMLFQTNSFLIAIPYPLGTKSEPFQS